MYSHMRDDKTATRLPWLVAAATTRAGERQHCSVSRWLYGRRLSSLLSGLMQPIAPFEDGNADDIVMSEALEPSFV